MFRILIIDPDPFTCRGLKELLSEAGYLVDSASNGKLALQYLRSQKVNLVITEMVMPEMDGVELIQALQKEHAQAKIVAISGGGMIPPGNYLRLARSLGVDQVLAKPFTQTELLETVKRVLSGNEDGGWVD